MVSTIYPYFSKAFDLVDHDILLRILQWYRVEGKALVDCFGSYLNSRQLQERLDGHSSDKYEAIPGVQQGHIWTNIIIIL